MATYIKAGFWEKAKAGFKGWLNLDDLIKSVTDSNIATVITENNIITNDNISTVIADNNIITTSDMPTVITNNGIVTSNDVTNIVALTQAEYDALVSPYPSTLYVIVEAI